MRPCQVKLRTMIPPLARNEQCGLETALKSCPPVEVLRDHVRWFGATTLNDSGYPFGSVRVSRDLTATPVSRAGRAPRPP